MRGYSLQEKMRFFMISTIFIELFLRMYVFKLQGFVFCEEYVHPSRKQNMFRHQR